MAEPVRASSDLKYGHGSALWKYWTTGEGHAKWAGAVHKWTTLRDLLLKAGVPPSMANGLATNIIMAVLPGYMKQAHAGAGHKSAGRPGMDRADTKPYGDVAYADPKNGKYPIDTKAHAMAAWSYINKPENAAKYPLNGVTLSTVKARIKAACKKFGIEVSEDSMHSASHAPDIDVVRSGGGLELQPDGGPLGTLTGRFSEFGRWYPVASKFEGDFLERVSPGSTADTIRDGRDAMRVLFDHGTDRQIGNKVLGPIDVLEERSDGPYYEVPLFDTSYNWDLLPGLEAGVYGASMRMRVTGDKWNSTPARSETNPEGIPERTITRMQVLEFGPVTFPANPGASAGIRSGTDEYYFRLREINTPAFEEAVRASGRSSEFFELPVIGRPPAGARAASGREEGDAPEYAEPDPTLSDRFRRDGEALALRGIRGVKLR